MQTRNWLLHLWHAVGTFFNLLVVMFKRPKNIIPKLLFWKVWCTVSFCFCRPAHVLFIPIKSHLWEEATLQLPVWWETITAIRQKKIMSSIKNVQLLPVTKKSMNACKAPLKWFIVGHWAPEAVVCFPPHSLFSFYIPNRFFFSV